MGMGWGILGWLIGLLSGSAVLAWIFSRSGGSAWPAAIWHGAFYFIAASEASDDYLAPILSDLVVAVAPLAWIGLGRAWTLGAKSSSSA